MLYSADASFEVLIHIRDTLRNLVKHQKAILRETRENNRLLRRIERMEKYRELSENVCDHAELGNSEGIFENRF